MATSVLSVQDLATLVKNRNFDVTISHAESDELGVFEVGCAGKRLDVGMNELQPLLTKAFYRYIDNVDDVQPMEVVVRAWDRHLFPEKSFFKGSGIGVRLDVRCPIQVELNDKKEMIWSRDEQSITVPIADLDVMVFKFLELFSFLNTSSSSLYSLLFAFVNNIKCKMQYENYTAPSPAPGFD